MATERIKAWRRGGSMKGLTPESWLCVDCGFDTAPGFLGRAAMEKAFEGLDEGGSINQYLDDKSEVFVVRDAIWKAAGMKPWGGCLCVGCIETRLGRALRPKDFVRRHPFNSMPGTARLRERRWTAPPAITWHVDLEEHCR
jgi:hypothetical protein